MDVHNQLTLLFLDASGGLAFMDPEWSGEFDLDVYGKIMAGIGVADVLSAEVYGKAGVHLELQYPETPTLQKLSIPAEAGITVVVVVWSHTRKFWEYEWVLKSNPGEYWVKQGVPPGDPGEFTPIPKDYLSGGEPYARFYPRTINPVQVEKALQTNVYPYSQPAIVSRDGKVFAFWIYDDPARSSLNRTKLVYSRLTEGIWSTPKAVWDDGTLDLRPEAAFLPDGRVLVVWENLNSQLADNAQLDDALTRMEIAYGVYDPAADTWQVGNPTGDGYFDHSPKLSAAQDGTALLTWTKNKANALFGSTDKPDTLAYALWNGSWSAPGEILTASKPVIKSSLAYNGTKGYLIWEGDEDNDLSTLNDRELRMLQFTRGTGWEAESQLTSNGYFDANPQVLFDDGIPVLFWLKDDDVAMARNLDLAGATPAVEDILSGGGVGFKAMSRPKGLMLFWADGSEEGADIYVARWDRATNRWGMRQQLTTDDLVERDIEGTVLDDNRFVLIYDKVTISYPPGGLEGEGIPEPQKTDLYFMTYEDRVDLMANYFFLSNPRTESEGIADPTPVPGDTVTLTVEVGNNGDTVEHDIPVLFYQGGKYIGSANVTGYLAPGQVGRTSLNWTVPEQRTLSFSAQIDPAYAPDDADRKNDVIGREITTKMLANPVAVFTYSPLAPKPGQSITFDATASYDPDGSITRYTWEFGDDQTAEGKIVTHTYQEAGEYDVLLKVRDNKALGGTIIRTVFVVEEGAPPPPPSNIFTDLIINQGETKELTEDIFVSGKLINNGTLQPGNYNIILVGDGTQEIRGNIPGKIVHSGSGTLQLIGSVTVGEFLNLTGEFNANGHTMTVNGPATVSGGSYQAGTGTQTFNGGLTVAGGTFNGSPGTVDVNGDLELSDGTLNAPGTLYVSGNWLHSGGTFNHNNKTVVFNGSTGQLITGNNTFYNLTINNSSGDKVDASGSTLVVGGTLQIDNGVFKSASDYVDVIIGPSTTFELAGNITVSGNFINYGTFIHNDYEVTFDGGTTQNVEAHVPTEFGDLGVSVGTTLVETEADDNITVKGTLTNNGTIRKTHSVSSTGIKTFGLTGVKVNVTAQGSLSNLQVDRIDANHPNAPTDGLKLGRYWTITPTGSGYTVDLTLPVLSSPYAGFTHNRARVFRYNPSTSTWDGARTSSSLYERIPGRPATTFGPVVTRTGITTLSDWTVGDPEMDLTVTDTPDPVVKNQILTYTLTVTNVGTSPASGVTLTNTLPPGVTYQSATATLPLLTDLILNTATVKVTTGGTTVSHTVTTGTTVINTNPGASAMNFSSSSWFTGTFTVDADAQKDDVIYFTLTDTNSDGLYDTIDFSMNNTTFRQGLTGNDIISLTGDDDETATTADLNGRALNFGPTPARFKLSRLDASPVSFVGDADPDKDAGIVSPWYVGVLSIDINGDQLPEDLDFVMVDPEDAAYMYSLINIDRNDSGGYSADEVHQSGDLIMLGGMKVQVTFPIHAPSTTYIQGKITLPISIITLSKVLP